MEFILMELPKSEILPTIYTENKHMNFITKIKCAVFFLLHHFFKKYFQFFPLKAKGKPSENKSMEFDQIDNKHVFNVFKIVLFHFVPFFRVPRDIFMTRSIYYLFIFSQSFFF